MADNLQLPQEIINIELTVNQDPLRKLLSDMLLELNGLKARIEDLENAE